MIELNGDIVYRHIVGFDKFCEGRCVRCGHLAGLFELWGRYQTICPCCAHTRVTMVDLQAGGLPEKLEVLREELNQEILLQARATAQSQPVARGHVWECHRCEDPVPRHQVRLIPAEGDGPERHHRICYSCFVLYRVEMGLNCNFPNPNPAIGLPGDPKEYLPKDSGLSR